MYVENIVIGNPIVEPSSMFAKDIDDWNNVEKEKLIIQMKDFYQEYWLI